MGTTISQEKRPSEKIRLSADFASVLLANETLVALNVTVSCVNSLTDVDSSATIISGAPTVSGSVITVTVQNGVDGEVHTLTFSTGLTSIALSYETAMNLIVTNSPSAENPLTTREEVKRQLRIIDASDDVLIDDLIVSASAYIRRRTGRDFTLQKYIERISPLPGEDICRLRLWNYPVQQIDRIDVMSFDGTTVFGVNDTTKFDFFPEGYVWWNDIFNNEYFLHYPDLNIITYRAGYAKIPSDVGQLAKDLVTGFYRGIGREGLSSEKIGDYAYTVASTKDFPGSILRELQPGVCEGVLRRYQRHELTLID